MMTAAMLTWCGTTTPVVENGDLVRVNYVGTTQEDGVVFDTSLEDVAKVAEIYNEERPYEPLEFPVWAWQMIPWFDTGVVWMKVWDKKTMEINAADGYGEYDDTKIQDIPLDTFSGSGITPEEWMQLNFWFTMGTVLEVGTWTVKVDLNHFLSGKDLIFEVEMVEIIKWWAAQVPAPTNPVEIEEAPVE